MATERPILNRIFDPLDLESIYNGSRHALANTGEFISRMPEEAAACNSAQERVEAAKAANPNTPGLREAEDAVYQWRLSLSGLAIDVRQAAQDAQQRGLVRFTRDSLGREMVVVETRANAGVGVLPIIPVLVVVAAVIIIVRFLPYDAWADSLATYQNKRGLAVAALEQLKRTGSLPAGTEGAFKSEDTATQKTTSAIIGGVAVLGILAAGVYALKTLKQ